MPTAEQSPKWLRLEVWLKNGIDTKKAYVGGFGVWDNSEKLDYALPVAFLTNPNLQEGWKVAQRVHESSPRSDEILFIDEEEAPLALLSPLQWETLLLEGKCCKEHPAFLLHQ